MIRDYIKLKGTIHFIGELVHIPRKKFADLYKKVLTFETHDGQVLFPEIRNKKIHLLEDDDITVGSTVEITVSFQGSEKNGKRYNNIFIKTISKI